MAETTTPNPLAVFELLHFITLEFIASCSISQFYVGDAPGYTRDEAIAVGTRQINHAAMHHTEIYPGDSGALVFTRPTPGVRSHFLRTA